MAKDGVGGRLIATTRPISDCLYRASALHAQETRPRRRLSRLSHNSLIGARVQAEIDPALTAMASKTRLCQMPVNSVGAQFKAVLWPGS
jgi:hypothetical protein